MNYRTWDEFWAKFLQVTFHLGNPDRWPTRERRAQWCRTHLNLQAGAKILNIGCGDGILDICLSRLGMEMTSVDRNPSVLSHAESEDDTRKVKFITGDFRQLNFPSEGFQAALFLESSGLVKEDEDQQLFNNVFKWLQPGGRFIVDCPISEAAVGTWSKVFPDGELTFRHSFDSATRIFRIEPSFMTVKGEVFGLMDPIRDERTGLSRYYYPKEEVTSMLRAAGFAVMPAEPHYYGENYFALIGTKQG